MIIVGVGVGPNMLTQEAIAAIRSAPDIWFRQVHRACEGLHQQRSSHHQELQELIYFAPVDAVMLSTGDPMFSGLGKFADENDKVILGVSSIRLHAPVFAMRCLSCRDLHLGT